jgi:hypothetical protein
VESLLLAFVLRQKKRTTKIKRKRKIMKTGDKMRFEGLDKDLKINKENQKKRIRIHYPKIRKII